MSSSAKTRASDRWLFFLIVTGTFNLLSAVLFPMLVTDAFTFQIFAVSIVPVIWGLTMFCIYRSKRERFVAWLGVAGAIYWLIPTIGMPIEFLGR